MFSVKHLKTGLNTEFIGHEIKYLSEIHSTNDDAWKCFENCEPEGTLIITDYQIQGRGRRKSKWSAIPGKSLTFSFLLLPKMPLEKLELLPLLTGISIVQGIHSLTNIQVGLKWPNDIMINQKKMGGILIESRTGKHGLGIVVGIGLNINESENEIPQELQNQATSLYIYSGEEIDRELILTTILNQFENIYLQPWHDIVPLWEKYCIHQNDEVTFHNDDKFLRGKFQGITDSGHAQIQLNGKIEIFSSGMVTL